MLRKFADFVFSPLTRLVRREVEAAMAERRAYEAVRCDSVRDATQSGLRRVDIAGHRPFNSSVTSAMK